MCISKSLQQRFNGMLCKMFLVNGFFKRNKKYLKTIGVGRMRKIGNSLHSVCVEECLRMYACVGYVCECVRVFLCVCVNT